MNAERRPAKEATLVAGGPTQILAESTDGTHAAQRVTGSHDRPVITMDQARRIVRILELGGAR